MIVFLIFFLIFVCLSFPVQDPKGSADTDRLATVERLYAEKKWEEIIRLLPRDDPGDSAELDLYRGLALAELQRWDEANAAFEAGREKEPRSKRFLLELAGVAYKQKNFPEAKQDLKGALALDPDDGYARNFLATLYFLDGNLEAALQHWNRSGKPRITEIELRPEPQVRRALLERAWAFSTPGVLRLDELRTTDARIRNLEIFPRFQFELLPAEEESFAVSFRATERNGWGDGKLDSLLSVFRGLPYQTINPEHYNLRHSAANFVSLLRWDAQKRRVYASLSWPLMQDPRWRFRIYADGRNENWDISRTFQGSTAPISDLKLEKAEAGAEIRSVVSDRLVWWSGASVARRTFHNFSGVNAPAIRFFTNGYSLKYQAGLGFQLLRSPERRITIESTASTQVGKVFAPGLDTFGKIEGSMALRWLPRQRGEDFEMNYRLRGGRTAGLVPFDELNILGIERDNDLWLRGHVGTRNGKKGSAPLGRNYALGNWEMDKIVYQHAFFTVKLGPFLDVGRITDPSHVFVSEGWLWDPGVQCKVRVLGSFGIVFSFGKDLRSGRNAFYTTVAR